jgi:hypothetical protein
VARRADDRTRETTDDAADATRDPLTERRGETALRAAAEEDELRR